MMALALAALLSGAAPNSVKYVGWEVAMPPGSGSVCGWDGVTIREKLLLDGPRRLRILVEVDHGKVGKIRLATEDCTVEPGTKELVMLPQVSAADSAAYLYERGDDTSMLALSLHDDAAGVERLILAARDRQNEKRQKRAFFWLARSKNPRAEAFIDRILR